MRNVCAAIAVMAASLSMAFPVSAENLYLRGKVALDDGSPPGKMVSIERLCTGRDPRVVATAGKSGAYLWRTDGEFLGADILSSSEWSSGGVITLGSDAAGRPAPRIGAGECVLRAYLPGYRSSSIDLSDRSLLKEPNLPLLVLSPKQVSPSPILPSRAAGRAVARC